MALRTAFRQMRWTTFGVLLAIAWTLLIAYEVATAFDWAAWATADFVGQAAFAGVVGVVVLAVFLGLMATLYSELTHDDPAPQAWPPSE